MKTKTQNNHYKIQLRRARLLYDFVLLRPIIIEETGGILRPQQYEDKPEYGEVIGYGSGKVLDNGTVLEPQVHLGDIVLFQRYSSEKVRDPDTGEDLLLVKEEDIRAIL